MNYIVCLCGNKQAVGEEWLNDKQLMELANKLGWTDSIMHKLDGQRHFMCPECQLDRKIEILERSLIKKAKEFAKTCDNNSERELVKIAKEIIKLEEG